MGLLLLFSLAEAACVIAQAYCLARAITNLWEGGALPDQFMLIAIFAACFFGRQLLLFIRDNFLARFAHERSSELREELLEGAFGSKTNLVNIHGTAAVSQAALEGVDLVETYLALILPKIIGVVAIPLPVFIAALRLDWISAVILLVFYPVIIFYMIMLGRQASARAAAQYETYNSLSNHFIDTLRGIETLAVFGQSKSYGKRIFKVSEDFRTATINTLKTATLSGAVLDLLATLGVAAVSIMLGFRLISGSIVLFPALMVLVLSPEFFKPIREFAGDFHESLDGKNALVNITRMIASKQEVHEEIEIAPWDEKARITFKDMDYSYARTDDGALEQINFSAQGFTKVGIVGTSGSGKSTLVNLLGGFAQASGGSIEVNGVQTQSLQQESWQRQLLYIPQDPYIFHASLRDNIRFYSPDADEATVAQAVDVCGLDELVAELPEGLDTIIGEGGRGLSGGQAQRIAFARALLDPARKILLFDEPTAHLDIETEFELKERMLPLMEGKLVFFATHRLHWLSAMDHILVLEGGHIVEQGSLEDLLAAQGKLVDLARAMNGGDVS